ncbi:MAG: hypothetical protein AAGI53_09045 [Planctomycetota bacterium]
MSADDADSIIRAWKTVLDDETLTNVGADLTVAGISTLRRRFPPKVVAVALDWARARTKVALKWPGRRVIGDVPGIEMASSERIASHKAKRFERSGGSVLDLCCGIGGDLMSLARVCDVEGVDTHAVRAWMAEANSGRRVLVTDATSIDLAGRLIHLDPARRNEGGRRTVRYDELVPGPEFVEAVAARARGACVKLMPGIDSELLPDGEVEYVSERGGLTQALLWTGALCKEPGVRATAIGDRRTLTITGDPSVQPPEREIDAFVFVCDPAVERAGLLGALCGQLDVAMPHPACGMLTASTLVSSDWLTSFRTLECLPWNRRRVRSAIRALSGGIVEVKTRGRVVDADAESAALRGSGDRPLTVFVVRMGSSGVQAVICERLGHASSVHPDRR